MERVAEVRTGFRWRGRDVAVAVALFAATAAAVLWQNARVAVLWDIGYILEIAFRMSLGQLPYREFPLVQAPLTFLLQAGIIRVGGRVFFHHVLYAAVVGGLATVVAWRIVLRELVGRFAWAVSVVLSAPLVVLGVYGIFPTPFYDCDCIAAVLVSVMLLQRLRSRGHVWCLAAGVVAVVPVFFKQNIGLPFLLVLVLGVLGMWALTRERVWGMVLAGVSAAMATALLLLHATVGLRSYMYWTVTFAGQKRLPGLAEMLGVYREPTLVWALPCVVAGAWLLRLRGEAWSQTWLRLVAVPLMAAPLVPVVLVVLRTDDADDRASALLALWPLLLVLAACHAVWRLWRREWGGALELAVLAAIHGTLLSQQLWGSTYAIWPLFVMLLASLLSDVEVKEGSGSSVMALAAFTSAVLLVCGGLYMRSADRLSYAHVEDGPVMRSRYASLRGMSVRGDYMPDLEQLLDFAGNEIPEQQGVLLLPGEDPFFYATGRVPLFPELLFDRTTDPYSPEDLMNQARSRGIMWVVVKTRLQLKADPMPERAEVMERMQREFVLYRRLKGYEVWKRK